MPRKISSNLKFFLGSFFLSLPFWWSLNIFQKNLEDFLFRSAVSDNPQIFTAQIAAQKELIEIKPARNWRIDNLNVEAKSAISVLVDSQGSQKIIFEKEGDEKLPIASVTKLMTADIVAENYDLSQPVEISKKAVKEEGDSGNFKIGETLTTKGLLYSMLIESSNDAAEALTEVIGEEAFVDLMNLQTRAIGMENTHFVNPTGLDSDNPQGAVNYSSAKDLVKLTSYLLKTNPEIFKISALPEYDLYTSDNVFHHKLINTDELLNGLSDAIASKTGWTPLAQGCLLLAIKAPNNKGIVINVILGSPDRFGEMQKLIDWVNSAYQW